MHMIALLVCMFAGLAPALSAQEIKIRVVGEGTVEAAPAAEPAARGIEAPAPQARGSEAMDEARRLVEDQAQLMAALMAEGDLTQEEVDRLIQQARQRLDRDLAKLEKRERENACEPDARDKAEDSHDIKKDRYRVSLRALERDLVYRIARLRKPGGDKFERPLDNLQDKIRDTYADLQDKIVDGPAKSWPATLELARKFHADFLTQIEKWGKEIGIDADVPNVDQLLKKMGDELVARARRLRTLGGRKYGDNFDSIIDRVRDRISDLREKLEDTPLRGWHAVLDEGEKFAAGIAAELDKWARQVGADEAMPSPGERLNALSQDLLDRISVLRKTGGEKFEDSMDALEDKVRDTFADLKEKVLNQAKEHWPRTLEDAAKHHREISEQIETWRLKIAGGARTGGAESGEPVPSRGNIEYPEKDVSLPAGVHADIVGGIRIARVQPILRKQLGLENGLEVKEITDADGALAKLGIEVYDIILEAEGVKVDTRSGMREVLDGVKSGEEFSVVIMRAGKKETLTGKK